MSEAFEKFEKHKERVIHEMNERILIYRKKNKKQRELIFFGQHAKKV